MPDDSTSPSWERGASQSGLRGEGEAELSRRNLLRIGAAGVAGAALGGTGLTGSAAASDMATPRLQRDGNLIVDPDGNTVTLRGVNIADPKRLNVTAPARGMDAVQTIDFLTDHSNDWYPRAIRVPVQPVDIGEYEPGSGPPVPAFTEAQLQSYLADHLDDVVQRCAERGVYCIIDYHRHRDVQWADGQNGPVNTELQDEVDMFWDTVAPRYADQTHVLYEVYNEPTEPGMWEDPTTTDWVADIWRLWLEMAQPWVDTIRSHADNMILMGSPSWSQSPEGALVEEFDGEDIAYTYHVYPGHNSSRANDWEDASRNGEGVAGVYEQAPLVVTEFGWEENAGQYIGGTTSDYGEPILEWMESSDAISWTAWIADPVWRPVMFDRPFTDSGDEDSIGNPYDGGVPEECPDRPCEWELLGGDAHMGDTVKETLFDLRNDNVPGGGSGDTTPPTTPSNLSVTGTTSSSVSVDWDASTDDDTGVDHYEVDVDAESDHEVGAGTTSTTVEGLVASTSYEVAVRAVDGAGNASAPATVTATTEEADDQTAPTAPSNLSVADTTETSVDVSWDSSTDEGGSGLDHYAVTLDGEAEQTVPAGTTSATVDGLEADTSYEIGVSAVDGAGNESDAATVSATTSDGGGDPPSDALVVNDYDGSPAWPDGNDLGNWNGAGSFQNGGGSGEVVDGALQLEYDNAGWFVEQIMQDVSDYSEIVLEISGASGGEGDHFTVDVGGARGTFSALADGSIGTSTSTVAIDMADAGIDQSSPGEFRLNFWEGGSGSSTISIEEIRIE